MYIENAFVLKDKLKTIYNTTSATFIYGINSRFNLGIRPRLRKVYRSTHPNVSEFFQASSYFDSDISFSRLALSGMEFIVRHPIKLNNINFTLQHQLGLPLGQNLEGSSSEAYIDWDGWSMHSQIFYSYYKDPFQIFIEAGIRADNLTSGTLLGLSTYFTYASIPISALPGFSIDSRNHIYLLTQYTPRWALQNQADSYYDPYANLGLGYKLFFLKNYEIEFIATRFFSNAMVNSSYTFNLGLRKIWGKNLYSIH